MGVPWPWKGHATHSPKSGGRLCFLRFTLRNLDSARGPGYSRGWQRNNEFEDAVLETRLDLGGVDPHRKLESRDQMPLLLQDLATRATVVPRSDIQTAKLRGEYDAVGIERLARSFSHVSGNRSDHG